MEVASLKKALLLGVAAHCLIGYQAYAQETEKEPANEEIKEEEELFETEEMIVTGSRLRGVDNTTNTLTINAAEIERMGVLNVEELMRAVPQTQTSVGNFINSRRETEIGAFSANELSGLGVAGVNLRGLGTGNTLVLVNGRRLAGAAGIEEGFVNLNSIPLSSVERVEISLGGGSAVYGSDALGGIVNFILKKNYTGFNASARYDFSDNGGDAFRASLSGGHNWETGSLNASISYNESKPVNNRKVGYVTNDYRQIAQEAYGLTDEQASVFDFRQPTDGAIPGFFNITFFEDQEIFPGFFFPVAVNESLQPAAGADVNNLTFADLVPLDSENIVNRIPIDAGNFSEQYSGTFNLEQRIGEKLTFTFDFLGSKSTNRLRSNLQTIAVFNVPFDQAYNPISFSDLPPHPNNTPTLFPQAIYFPGAEYDDGRLQPGTSETEVESYSFSTGLEYDFSDTTNLALRYTYSETNSSGTRTGINTVVGVVNGVCQANGFNNEIVENLDQVVAAQCEAITSSDPDLAFNFLNDGTSTAGASPEVFNVTTAQLSNKSKSEFIEAVFQDRSIEIPGGKIGFVLGGDYRTEFVDGEFVRTLTVQPATREVYGLFSELRIPLVGQSNSIPIAKRFDISLQARYDRYESEGAVSTVDNIPVAQGGEIIIGEAVFEKVSPRVGLAWSPVEDLSIRAQWNRGFTAPNFTSLYNVGAGTEQLQFVINDPLDPLERSFIFDQIPVVVQANPDLKPQTSDTYQIGFTFAPRGKLSGLVVEFDYYETTIKNQTSSVPELQFFLSPEELFSIPDLFLRDDEGFLIGKVVKPVNIAFSKVRSYVLNASYTFTTSIGAFVPRITYTKNLQQDRQFLEGTDPVSTLGQSRGLDRYRIDANLQYFADNGLNASLTARYIPSYLNNYYVLQTIGGGQDPLFGLPVEGLPVDDHLTFDLSVTYRFENGLKLSAGGRNIFNAAPSLSLIDRKPFDATKYDPRGRVLFLDVNYEF